jgi:hypothetical protein
MRTRWSKEAANRREFLRGGLRYALLTTLGAVSANLARRPGATMPGQTCMNQGICSGCTAFAGCGQPQALSAKQFNPRSSRREEAQTHPGKKQSLLMSAATVEKGAV